MKINSQQFLWPNWVDVLKERAKQQGVVRFIGYGSLINPESAKRTITDSEGQGQVVIAFGVKRIFNFSLAESDYIINGGRNEKSSIEKHRACLNALPTGNENDKLVGVLINLRLEDIDSFAKREYGYDIALVTYITSNPEDNKQEAFILIANKKEAGTEHVVKDDILPNESYLITCLKGAMAHGEDFLDSWLDSCYLADGKTKLLEDKYYREFINSQLEILKA